MGGLDGIAGDGGLRFGAVGQAGGVAEVEEMSAGQAPEQGAEDRQAAEAGVEDADGVVRREMWMRRHFVGSLLS